MSKKKNYTGIKTLVAAALVSGVGFAGYEQGRQEFNEKVNEVTAAMVGNAESCSAVGMRAYRAMMSHCPDSFEGSVLGDYQKDPSSADSVKSVAAEIKGMERQAYLTENKDQKTAPGLVHPDRVSCLDLTIEGNRFSGVYDRNTDTFYALSEREFAGTSMLELKSTGSFEEKVAGAAKILKEKMSQGYDAASKGLGKVEHWMK